MFQQATRIIGIVLALASLTEFVMSNIIADHFSENVEKRNQMFSFINGTLSLDEKRKILTSILSENYGNITVDYPKLENRLEALRKFRNIVAHSYPDTREAYLAEKHTDRVRLVWYRNGRRKSQDVTHADAQNRIRDYTKLFLDIEEIRQKIGRFPSV